MRSLLGSEPEVPCVQCDRRERGLAWGDYCSVCKEERRRRANRPARLLSAIAAVLMGAWLTWRTPARLGPRMFAAASVVLTYVVVRRIVFRAAMEFLPRVSGDGGQGAGDRPRPTPPTDER